MSKRNHFLSTVLPWLWSFGVDCGITFYGAICCAWFRAFICAIAHQLKVRDQNLRAVLVNLRSYYPYDSTGWDAVSYHLEKTNFSCLAVLHCIAPYIEVFRTLFFFQAL